MIQVQFIIHSPLSILSFRSLILSPPASSPNLTSSFPHLHLHLHPYPYLYPYPSPLSPFSLPSSPSSRPPLITSPFPLEPNHIPPPSSRVLRCPRPPPPCPSHIPLPTSHFPPLDSSDFSDSPACILHSPFSILIPIPTPPFPVLFLPSDRPRCSSFHRPSHRTLPNPLAHSL